MVYGMVQPGSMTSGAAGSTDPHLGKRGGEKYFLEPQISVIFRGWIVMVTTSYLPSSSLLAPLRVSNHGLVEGSSPGNRGHSPGPFSSIFSSSLTESSSSSFHSKRGNACFNFHPLMWATDIDPGVLCDWSGWSVLMLFLSSSAWSLSCLVRSVVWGVSQWDWSLSHSVWRLSSLDWKVSHSFWRVSCSNWSVSRSEWRFSQIGDLHSQLGDSLTQSGDPVSQLEDSFSGPGDSPCQLWLSPGDSSFQFGDSLAQFQRLSLSLRQYWIRPNKH